MRPVFALWLGGAGFLVGGLFGRWDLARQRQVPRSARWMGANHSLDDWRRETMTGIRAMIFVGSVLMVAGTGLALWHQLR